MPVTDRHTHTHTQSIKHEYYILFETNWIYAYNRQAHTYISIYKRRILQTYTLNQLSSTIHKKTNKKTEHTHTGICHYIFSQWVYEASQWGCENYLQSTHLHTPQMSRKTKKRDKEHSPLHTVDVMETMQFCGPALLGVNVLFSSAMKRNHHHQIKQHVVPQLSSSKHLLSGTLFQLRYALFLNPFTATM